MYNLAYFVFDSRLHNISAELTSGERRVMSPGNP
jgi:hypothetical protein